MNYLFIISGPGGSGKDTLINELIKNNDLNIIKLVNHTSRPPRVGETDGKHYHFLSKNAFESAVNAEEMLEHEIMTASGHYYGTGKVNLELLLKTSNVICTKMPFGAMNLKKHFGNTAVTIFLDANNDELSRRLLDKSRINEQNLIPSRLKQAENERDYKSKFDYQLTNHDGRLEDVVKEVTQIILDIMSHTVPALD